MEENMDGIEKQFNRIAKEYDENRRKFIPCFEDYYKHTTKLILSNLDTPKSVLDLGAGTGLLTCYWYQECKTADYVLVDIADEMLDISRKRFAGLENIHHQLCDYTKQLPDGKFDAVISALSIHHLEDRQKAELFYRIYEMLPVGGVFANYDQFCAGSPMLDQWFDSYWEKQLYKSGLTDTDIELWRERRKLDRECSVEEEIKMLKECRFSDVKCLYSYHKFSTIIAIK